MKKNTKILIGIGAIALIILVACVVTSLQKAKDTVVIKPNEDTPPVQTVEIVKTKLSELKLKQEDLLEVNFDGFEGEAHAYVIQKDIPELTERIQTRVEEINEQINTSDANTGNQLIEEQKAVRKLGTLAICSYEGDGNFKNGDEITIKCDAEGLKKINIIIDETYSVKVSGLNPYIAPVEENKTEDNSNVTIETPEEETAYIGLHENGKYAWIYPYNIDELSADELPDTVETIIVFVNNEEEFELIKSKALSGELKVDEIQFINDVYEKEDNFTEAKEWKGVAY